MKRISLPRLRPLSIGSRQLNELANDIVTEQLKEALDQREIATEAEQLENAVADLRLAFGVDARRDAWSSVEHEAEIVKQLDRVQHQLQGHHRCV